MNESIGPKDDLPGPEEKSVLSILRASARMHGDRAHHIDEVLLAAYVLGTASHAERAEVHAALNESPRLRQQLLDLMQSALRPASAEERQVFDRATPPPLDKNPDLAALATSIKSAATKTGPRTTWRAPLRRRWLEWLLGSWAMTATAAVCLLSVMLLRSTPPTLVEREPSSRDQGPGATSSPSLSSGPLGITLDRVQTVALRSPSRGLATEPLTIVTVSPSTRVLRLSAEPPPVPEGSHVRLTLIGPDGKVQLAETRPVEDFFAATVLAIRSQNAFLPGRYVLTITGRGEVGHEEVIYPFVLRISAR